MRKKIQIKMFKENPRHMSASNEHYTPPYIVEASRRALGSIDLDPASNEEVNKWSVNAEKIYDSTENGFINNWNGNVFLNPPGGSCDAFGTTIYSVDKKWSCKKDSKCEHVHNYFSSQKHWWRKLCNEWKVGNVISAVFVGFSVEILQTTQVDSDGMIPLDFPLCFPKRRISYFNKAESVDGSVSFFETSSPPHSSVIVFLPEKNLLDFSVYDESIDRFYSNFSDIGKVVIPRNWG